MRALTLTQPYASLVALGAKTIETRSWRAPRSLLGERFAIHAGLGLNPVGGRPGLEALFNRCEFCDGLREAGQPDPTPDSLPRGVIVATVVLRDCVATTGRFNGGGTGDEAAFGDYSQGRWAWYLDAIERVEPIACKGKQGVWNVPAGVAELLWTVST